MKTVGAGGRCDTIPLVRIGSYPERVKREFIRTARVSACIVVHIPHQLDYHAHRLDVLRLCLASLAAHTPRDRYDLLVLDNGSCAATVDYLRGLRDRGAIDHLILSAQNIGKINGCRMLFDAAPGDVVAYADDDVFFSPGWLEAQLAILDTFPRVGMVSGRPVRKQFGYGNAYLPGYLAEFPEITSQTGRLIPNEWEREFRGSVGRLQDDGAAAPNQDVLLEYRGLKAYSTATHFQFIAPKAVILDAIRRVQLPRVVGEERQFEEAIDAAGYARLSTAGRYVRHIGNVINRELRDEIGETLPEMATVDGWRPSPRAWVRLMKWRPLRALLARVNRWTYLALHHP